MAISLLVSALPPISLRDWDREFFDMRGNPEANIVVPPFSQCAVRAPWYHRRPESVVARTCSLLPLAHVSMLRAIFSIYVLKFTRCLSHQIRCVLRGIRYGEVTTPRLHRGCPSIHKRPLHLARGNARSAGAQCRNMLSEYTCLDVSACHVRFGERL